MATDVLAARGGFHFTPAAEGSLDCAVDHETGRLGRRRRLAAGVALLVTGVFFAAPPAIAILVLAGVLY